MTDVLPVLMYHSVPASGAGGRLAVPRPLVDRQWRALRNEGWAIRGLTEALAGRDGSTVAVTFDDGYADLLGAAAPAWRLARQAVYGATGRMLT